MWRLAVLLLACKARFALAVAVSGGRPSEGYCYRPCNRLWAFRDIDARPVYIEKDKNTSLSLRSQHRGSEAWGVWHKHAMTWTI
jgi:hypothetical protein